MNELGLLSLPRLGLLWALVQFEPMPAAALHIGPILLDTEGVALLGIAEQ
jgi:hypothetical protein